VAFLLGWNRYPSPCAGLVWDEAKGRFYCRAVLDEPARTRKQLKRRMAIGAGCSSSLFNTQREACRGGTLKAYLASMGKKG
jgi:hypothetical protein